MPVFNVEADGKRFKIEAPDQETALAAFGNLMSGGGEQPATPHQTAENAYTAALENYRAKQYPDMAPDEFQRMAASTDRLSKADIGDLASNGVVFGLGDEINSLLDATGSQIQNWMGAKTPGFGEAFSNTQSLQDARLNLAREETGILGAGAELGSSLATMGPARAALEQLVSGGGRVAAELAPSLLRQGVEGATTGAVLGGVGGFTNAQGNAMERLPGGAEGALGGSVIGAAAPMVMRGVGAAWDGIGSRLAANEAAERMGVRPDSARFVQSTLAADDALSDEGIARILRGGDEGMLADAGRSAQNALDYAIQSSGGAGRMASEAINGRVTRDAGAIDDALNAALGDPQGVETMRQAVRTGTAAERSAAYRGAYSQPIDYSSNAGRELEDMLQRVDPAVIRRANALMRTEGERSAQIMAEIGDDGAVTFRTMPDVRQIDYITRALNEEASAGIGAGAMGGQTQLGSALQNLSRDIRDVLRSHIPAYDEALGAGRDAIQTSQALQNGYEALSPATTREQVASTVRGLSDADRRAYAAGIRSRLDDALANVTRTVMDGDVPAREAIKTLRDLSTRASREKVAEVIGGDAATELFGEIDRAAQSFELRARVADNSKTFQRQEMGRRVDASITPDNIVSALGRGEPVNAGKRAVQAATGFTDERALAGKDAMMSDVARILLSQGPEAINAAQTLSRLGQRTGNSDAVRRALIANAGVGGPVSYQYGRQRGESR